MKICLYGASSNFIDKSYIQAVEELGEIMAKRGHTLVYGGGSGGLMGAAARGMTAQNGEIIGISPSFFKVDGELYDKCTDFIYTETMSERKKLLEDYAEAFVVVPGGPGTFDELFETLALRQLGIHNKPIAIFNVNGYYNYLEAMLKNSVTEGFMMEECLELTPLFENADVLLDYLEKYDSKGNEFSVLRKLGKDE